MPLVIAAAAGFFWPGLRRDIIIFGRLAIVLTTVGLLSAGPAAALQVPPLKGRINDTAGMISPATERLLESTLQRFEQAESTQIVVLTIPSLEGESLEDFSIRVADEWRIGRSGSDNGAILLIAKADRKLRIEVGYGLEGRLTDAVAGRIIRHVIVPQFRAGKYDQGIADGVNAMIQAVRGEFDNTEGDREKPAGAEDTGSSVFYFFVLLAAVSRLGRINRGLGAAAGGVLAPVFSHLSFGLGWPYVLLAIPVGLLFGFVASTLFFSSSGGGFTGGFMHGGRHFGGLGRGGGFSGGGGGFGGGGASGSW